MAVVLRTNLPAPAFVKPAVPASTDCIVVVLPDATVMVGVVPASVKVCAVNVMPVASLMPLSVVAEASVIVCTEPPVK